MASKKVNKVEASRILQELNYGQKTYVSLVMELATRLGVETDFKETNELTWDTGTAFKYNAKLGDMHATGQGRSKKEAKQNSAKAILDIIRGCDKGDDSGSSDGGCVTPVRYLSPSPSPGSVSGPPSVGNAVGDLQNLAVRNRWKTPEYEFPEAKGEPHRKTFTCLVKMMSGLECRGTGSTKKSAKRQAAEKMLNMLQGDGDDVVDAQDFAPSSPLYNQVSSPNSSILDSSDLEDYHSSSSDSPSANLDEEETLYFDEYSTTKIESKSISENFKHEYIPLPSKSKKQLYQVFLKLTFPHNREQPPVVTHGSGETENIARSKAAERALKHLEFINSLP